MEKKRELTTKRIILLEQRTYTEHRSQKLSILPSPLHTWIVHSTFITKLTHVLPQPFPEPVKEPHQEKGLYIILTRWACPTVEDTHTTNICPPPIIRAWLRNNEGRRPRPCQIKKVFTLGLANHAIQPGYIHHWLGHHHIC